MAPFKRFLAYLIPYSRSVALVVLLNVGHSAMALLVPQVFRYIIDVVVPTGDVTLLVHITIASVIFFLGKAGIYFGNMFLVFIIAHNVILDVRMELYGHIQRLPLRYFESRRSGSIVSRIMNDVGALEQLILTVSSRLLGEMLQIVAVAAILVYMNLALGVSIVIMMVLLASFFLFYSRKIRAISSLIQSRLAGLTAIAQEMVSGIKVVKSFGMEEHEYRRYREESEDYRDLNVRRRGVLGVMDSGVDFLGNLALVSIFFVGGYLAIGDRLSIGTLAAYVLYLRIMLAPMRSVIMFTNIFQRGAASLERIFEVMDTQPEDVIAATASDSSRPAGGAPVQVEGRITFDSVFFKYRDDTDHILSDVSFSVDHGETVALVGPSGAGKTTIVNLIPRFYDPTSGSITLDGIDLRELDLEFLRRQVGIVLQDPVLFSGSVAENIAYGRPDATAAEIQEAARISNSLEFVERLPRGYDTDIGERGVKLSGGQKQRLAIARAVLKDPRIIILDEATSFQDSESEVLIQEALENVLENRTTFIIAHRLSTVTKASQIIVIRDGRIVEKGSHRALLRQGGAYRRFFEVQFRDALNRPMIQE